MFRDRVGGKNDLRALKSHPRRKKSAISIERLRTFVLSSLYVYYAFEAMTECLGGVLDDRNWKTDERIFLR